MKTDWNLVSQEQFNRFSTKQQQIVRAVEGDPSFAAFESANKLALRVGVSTATVIRLAQTLGFRTYGEFQQNIRHRYLGDLMPLQALETRTSFTEQAFDAQMSQDIQNLRRITHTLRRDIVWELAEAINNARQVVIIASGSGSASVVGIALGHLLRFMGFSALAEDRGGSHLSAAVSSLEKEDLLIGITFWRGNSEVSGTMKWVSGKGVPTAAITDSVFSSIAAIADKALIVPTESASFFQSAVAPLSIIYALIAHLAAHADPKRRSMMEQAQASYDQIWKNDLNSNHSEG